MIGAFEYLTAFDVGNIKLNSAPQNAYKCPNASKFSTPNSAAFVSAGRMVDLAECSIDHEHYLQS